MTEEPLTPEQQKERDRLQAELDRINEEIKYQIDSMRKTLRDAILTRPKNDKQ